MAPPKVWLPTVWGRNQWHASAVQLRHSFFFNEFHLSEEWWTPYSRTQRPLKFNPIWSEWTSIWFYSWNNLELNYPRHTRGRIDSVEPPWDEIVRPRVEPMVVGERLGRGFAGTRHRVQQQAITYFWAFRPPLHLLNPASEPEAGQVDRVEGGDEPLGWGDVDFPIGSVPPFPDVRVQYFRQKGRTGTVEDVLIPGQLPRVFGIFRKFRYDVAKERMARTTCNERTRHVEGTVCYFRVHKLPVDFRFLCQNAAVSGSGEQRIEWSEAFRVEVRIDSTELVEEEELADVGLVDLVRIIQVQVGNPGLVAALHHTLCSLVGPEPVLEGRVDPGARISSIRTPSNKNKLGLANILGASAQMKAIIAFIRCFIIVVTSTNEQKWDALSQVRFWNVQLQLIWFGNNIIQY